LAAADEDRGFSSEQRSGLQTHQADQDRTLEAMHHLEAALSEAAPGREASWRESVLGTLSVLEAAAGEEAANAKRPDSLLSDLARTQPRLRNRARALRIQYNSLRETINSIRREIEEHQEAGADFSDMRQRLGWVLTALRHQRARESDLIYEAYFEAFNDDLRNHPLPGQETPS
jgi:chromosome segregation ATPase